MLRPKRLPKPDTTGKANHPGFRRRVGSIFSKPRKPLPSSMDPVDPIAVVYPPPPEPPIPQYRYSSTLLIFGPQSSASRWCIHITERSYIGFLALFEVRVSDGDVNSLKATGCSITEYSRLGDRVGLPDMKKCSVPFGRGRRAPDFRVNKWIDKGEVVLEDGVSGENLARATLSVIRDAWGQDSKKGLRGERSLEKAVDKVLVGKKVASVPGPGTCPVLLARVTRRTDRSLLKSLFGDEEIFRA